MKNKEMAKAHKIEVERGEANEIKERLEGCCVKISAAGGTDGRLYGSVTSKDVAEALEQQFGISIDRRKIDMDAVRSYGNFSFDVKLYNGVTGKINLIVVEK